MTHTEWEILGRGINSVAREFSERITIKIVNFLIDSGVDVQNMTNDDIKTTIETYNAWVLVLTEMRQKYPIDH